MYKSTPIVIGTIIALLSTSCASYTIPVSSFREQMINAQPEKMKAANISTPLFFYSIRYHSNDIESIKVIDKKGKECTMYNSPSIEMRVTHQNGKRYCFYFDTVVLENDTIKGSRSRFAPNLSHEIPLAQIVKIEIQDGRKNFKYKY